MLGRPIVRIDATAAAVDREQRIGLLGAVAEDAARPMILERAADEVDAVGEQRRGDRVAGVRLDGLAVEAHARSACRDRCGRLGKTEGCAIGSPLPLVGRGQGWGESSTVTWRSLTPPLSLPSGGGDRSRTRARRAHRIGGDDPVARRIAQRVEPALAAVRMQPALGVHALRVGPVEEILRPVRIVDAARGRRAGRCAPRRRSGTRSRGARRSRGKG